MGSSSPFSSTTFDFDGEWIDWPARNRKDVHYHDSAHRHIPKQIFVTSVWGWKTSTPEVIQWRLIGFFKGHGLRRWQYDSITKFIYISRWFFVSPDAWSLSCWVVVLKIVYVHPLFGEIIPIWLRFFKWNHQLGCMFLTVFFFTEKLMLNTGCQGLLCRKLHGFGKCCGWGPAEISEWLTCESLGERLGRYFSDYEGWGVFSFPKMRKGFFRTLESSKSQGRWGFCWLKIIEI